LVAPIGSVNNEPVPPLALAYLASSLKKAQIEVQGIDATGLALNTIRPIPNTRLQYNGLGYEEIIQRINPKTRIVAISTTFTHEWNYVRESIIEIKNAFPNALIIGGGEHFSSIPEYCLRECPSLDFIGIGEGEDTLVEFCQTILRNEDPWKIDGLCYLMNNKFIQTPQRTRIRNIDEIPWPDWELFDIAPYFANSVSFGASFGRNMPMMLSRGCPYRCTFCSNPQMWTTRYYLRSVDDVINEIKYYIKQFQITGIQFYDLTAVVKKNWIVDFCQSLVANKIDLEWSLPSGTRSEALDGEVISWFSKTNLRYLVYAPESASSITLKSIKKQISFERMVKSVREAIRQKIVVRTNFIIGFPKENRKELYKTLWAQLKLSFYGVDEAPLFPFQPYPGTELFDYLVAKKRIVLSPDYFNSLATLSNGRLSPPDHFYSEYIGKTELFFYRITGTFLSYLISYSVRPQRILRTIKNLFFVNKTATVFEQRIKDKFRVMFRNSISK
tara:strand:- start:163 stop:1662 length:1500 start_codon:yes stop_codon:yes gene_type:complete